MLKKNISDIFLLFLLNLQFFIFFLLTCDLFFFLIIKMKQNNCQLRNSQEKGEGLYALKDFKRGDQVYQCVIEVEDTPNHSHASQIGMDKFVQFSLIGRSINHSCNPNCGIGFDGKNWSYKAIRDIKVGDQLTYDYAMANYKVESMPECLCGSQNCRKQIKGFRNLDQARKKQYKGFFAPYLQAMLEQN